MAKLPKRRIPDTQGMFDNTWVDRPVSSYHQAAVFVGDFFEEATSVILGGQRLTTDATTDICPDVKLRTGLVVESKASLRSHYQYVLVLRQLKMYDEYVTAGGKVIYLFWIYDLGKNGKNKPMPVFHYKWREELRDALAESDKQCFMMSFEALEGMLLDRKKPVNYGSDAYPPFIRLYSSDVKSLENISQESISSIRVYNREIPAFPLVRTAEIPRRTDEIPWRKYYYDEEEVINESDISDAEDEILKLRDDVDTDNDVPF